MKRSHGFILLILLAIWLMVLIWVPSIRFGINHFFASLPLVGPFFNRFTSQYIESWFSHPQVASFLPSLIVTVLILSLLIFNSIYSFSTHLTRLFRSRYIRKSTRKFLSKTYFTNEEPIQSHDKIN